MKFKIVQSKQGEEKVGPVTKLSLRFDVSDDVDVIATDAKGIEYSIISFLADEGTLFRYSTFGSGFKTNKNGQIVVVK